MLSMAVLFLSSHSFTRLYRYLVFKVHIALSLAQCFGSFSIALKTSLKQFCRLSPGHFSPIGGDNEIRTHDPLLARQVLSQLSYTPICFSFAKLAPEN